MKKCNVFLRAFNKEDYVLINKWRQDEDFFKMTTANKYFISPDRDKEWVMEKIMDDRYEIYLAVCLKSNEEMIGYLSIKNIDWQNRKARWGGIHIIKKYQGKGYALEASKLMLNHVFNELGLNKFYGYWLVDHLPSIAMGKKLGFVHEGEIRDEVFKLGKFHNVVLMSILRSEYLDIDPKEE